ncbi:MAG TPA: DUF1707 domain-containing protein [Solirubrobacteraceae bacterium]|nr:DUF1707 domain-containing protein [Solirubrobacteraceae bacterium]
MDGARIVGGLASRPGDGERDLALEGLKVGYATGRLTCDEFEARAERVLRARSRGELALGAGAAPLGFAARHWLIRLARRAQRALLRAHAALYATFSAAVVAVWALTGAGAFWPAWLVVPGAAILGWHALVSRKISRALDRRELPRPLGR